MRSSRRRSRGVGHSALEGLAAFVTRRPRLVLGVWALVIGGLALYGLNISDRVSPNATYIDGTDTKRVHEIALQRFGSDQGTIVVLRGPEAAVERQGKKLASRLNAEPGTLVVSPWSPGAIDGLRPEPGVAGLVVRVNRSGDQPLLDILTPVETQVNATVREPVDASIAGLPKVFESFRDAGDRAALIGELIAMPVLLLVLLFVFRSVIAALIPVIVGGAVVGATRGVLSVLSEFTHIDVFALGVVGMLGLALGVDYSLLVVSRFREERGDGDLSEAVQRTMLAAARSIIPAGTGLILSVLVAAQILPGSVLISCALAGAAATVLSIVSALCVVPSVLLLLGNNLDRWSLPKRGARQGASLRWSRRLATSRAAVLSILFLLLFLSGWALSLNSSQLTPELLPAGDPGRVELEEVEHSLGPGWLAPIEVIMNGRGEPVTLPSRLRALTAFQHRVERDPGVQSMAGFSEIESGTRPLGGVEDELAEQESSLARLGDGISRTEGGAEQSSEGFRSAADGAGRLGSGLEESTAGAGLLVDGLEATSSGSDQLATGLEGASEGSGRLAESGSKASSGAGRLADALEKAQTKSGEMQGTVRLTKEALRSGDRRLAELHGPLKATEERLAAAWDALQRMTTGRSDPEYAAAQRAIEEASQQLSGTNPRTEEQTDPGYRGVDSGVSRAQGQFSLGLYLSEKTAKSNRLASKNVGKLAKASRRLDRGIEGLAGGIDRLSGGIGELSEGGEKLSPALQELQEGTESLAGGLDQLGSGANRLASGLGTGARESEQLAGGLHRISSNLSSQQESESGFDRLQTSSPGLFKSGYFYLASLDGNEPEQRSQTNFLINLDSGGDNARMLIIPREGVTTDQGRETLERVRDDAAELERRTGAEVLVGGQAAGQLDIDAAYRDATLQARIILMFVTFLILVLVLRSLVVPVLAAVMNLLTVSASLGLLALLFDGSLLGGPGYVDSLIVPATVMVMFGLAIDYEVFIFARIREEYVRTGSSDAAIRNGLDHVAPVVTGAAIIMIAVFLAFSVSSLITVRNFGVAQAIAVFIDAFVIRLILVPALMSRLGKWNWWMPEWLDRLLPGGARVAALPEEQGGTRVAAVPEKA